MFVICSSTLVATFGRFVYQIWVCPPPTPEELEEFRKCNEKVSKELEWTHPIRNYFYADEKKKKDSS